MTPAMTTFHWIGQACFLITTLFGTRVLVDPSNPQVGYPIAPHSIPANIVFVSHEHPDHNYVDAAAPVGTLAPRIVPPMPLIDGTAQAIGTYRVERRGHPAEEVNYNRISAYHDTVKGAARGPDTMTLIKTGGLRILHMGDIGELQLTPTQLKDIGSVDVLMIPVGGFYTVDGAQAAALVNQLHPRVIIPMHYRTPALNADLQAKLGGTGEFLRAMRGRAAVATIYTRDLKLSPETLPRRPTIYLLRY
ncbi:MAG: MBL fold metallo-hydrolase, partial [Chloroflexi bacterium]|nr:MBL fold metallo-hydrolase [Chloroflexota bacterium]